jgi:UDP-glucuronate 4-epimerase
MRRYVVTGGAGFIGSQLVEALLAHGHDVVAIDCFVAYYDVERKRDNARSFDVRELDLSEVQPDLEGVDGVFHLAAQPGTRSFGETFPEYLRHNVLASQRVFEAAARAGVRVVFASSSSVYGDAAVFPTTEEAATAPISPYGVTKLAAEHLAAAYAHGFGLDVVVLRYFNVYGPRQRPDMAFARIIDALIADRPFPLHGAGDQSRSWTYVDDVVGATIAAMGSGDGIYNVAGDAEASLQDAIGLLEGFAGRKLVIQPLPEAPGDVHRTHADTTRIRRDLGWQSSSSFTDGLRAQWDWASRP